MAVGRPVKLMWPREEDFTHDQYRPMGVIGASAGLDANRNIVGWKYRVVSPSLSAQRGAVLPATGDGQGSEAAANLPYAIGTRVTEYVSHPSPIPIGYWRSVGASLNTFAVECTVDELAALAGEDPYLFRRLRITDPRWIAVLDAAANLGGWSTPVAAGHARGIAIGAAFNSIVAEVVDASLVTTTSSTGVVTTTVKVNSVAVAIDSYLTVNPGQVEHQIIGGVVHGLNAALHGHSTITNGAVQNNNFRNNRMIRLNEMPTVKVTAIPNPTTLSRTATIGGVGELGVPTLAPALANAYFKLTGTRVRSLPFYPTATMGGL
jgi:isoquinoline 1-oxidoreductase beta subunit